MGGYAALYAFNHEGNSYDTKAIKVWADCMNIIPQLISLIVLLDALRRLRNITAGSFMIDTLQMVIHIVCFILVVSSGAWLVKSTSSRANNINSQ